jgi:hypothetical protein
MTMKKLFALTIILLMATAGLAMADIAATASSAIDFTNGAAGQIAEGAVGSGNNIAKLSTGVAAGWNCTTSGYALITAHTSGTKTFGTAHDSTAIYTNANKPLTAPSAADVSGVNSAGWSAL